MQNLTNEQKAQAYNNLLHQYQRLQESQDGMQTYIHYKDIWIVVSHLV